MTTTAIPTHEGDTAIIVHPPKTRWYQNVWNAVTANAHLRVYLAGILLLLGIALASSVSRPQKTNVKAGTSSVRLSVQPAGTSLPPGMTFQIWATADSPVAFVTVKLTFDPDLIQMTGEITTGSSPLTRIVRRTPMAEANTTGVIFLSLGLDPASRSTPPTGTFQLAGIPLSVKTTAQNQTASVHLDASGMQVVNPDATVFTITTADSTLTLNPTEPTATPSPTSTPTVLPADTPTPTPAPTPADTVPPTVTITYPENGTTVSKNTKVTIAATATDNTGVAKVVFLVDDKSECTVTTAPYSCDWTPRGKGGTVALTAKAYDSAGNTATAGVTVTQK